MLVSHKLNQHSIIDMLPIIPVTGQVSRLSGLTRLWSDFRNYWDRRDAQSQSASEVPTPPAAPLKQALPNFRLGTRGFLALQRSMGRARNNGKTATNIHLEAAGLAVEKQEEHGTHKAIVPIPKNAPGELPIKPEKPKDRLVANTTDGQQQPAMKRSSSSKRKQKRAK